MYNFPHKKNIKYQTQNLNIKIGGNIGVASSRASLLVSYRNEFNG